MQDLTSTVSLESVNGSCDGLLNRKALSWLDAHLILVNNKLSGTYLS